ncbi:arf-GAP with dual PH domain-containing protein 1-like isoform X1 [Spea bombifrons]|uniref:arf-GAP with dual PH domain-containing protein 1-like isoform X1 n=2 Tax=Spea bombifrons TaxID=233779 RepID=UPI0023496333|nr:arf-GAP with dual PH domain-containing protein 1-like isoform X1 [Spea bombifrons]
MSGEHDWNKTSIRNLITKEWNTKCADCGAPDPGWASFPLGVFICVDCSGIHRNLSEISKVRSLTMDHWEETQIQFLENHGNDVAKKIYEANVPVYYYKPTHKDCHVLREQWIRSKYERKEFVGKGISNISYGVKKGNLFKKGRDNGQYLSRLFILSEMDGTLKYFTRPDAKEPKAVIKVDSINASFQPEKMKQFNGLQITYIKDNRTRNIFLYHSDGQEIVSWFNAIRSAQYRYMQVAFPTASDNEIVRRLTRNFIKEGYMEKTGPKLNDGFKKRWFTLDNRRLMYFKDPLDAFAKGEVFLGSSENGYHVMAETISSSHGNPMWNYGISFSTPERTYLFSCETESEQESWIHAFKSVISQPMTLREYTIEAQFKRRP